MAKELVVERFLQEGFLVSPKLLEQIPEDNLDSIITSIKLSGDLIIENLDVQKEEAEFKVKNYKEKTKLKTSDFVEYYGKKYNVLKDIISKKLNPNSIDKAKTFSEASIIGMVYEYTNNGLVIEDPTGKLEIRCNRDGVLLNSVLGFIGKIKEGIMLADRIIYPDIPLDNEIRSLNMGLVFSEKGQVLENLKTVSFNQQEGLVSVLTNPGYVKINKELVVLSYKPKEEIPKERVVIFLKNRFVTEETPSEKYLIKDAPSIFWIDQEKQWVENYKGVTIVSGKEIKIDLKDRKVEFLEYGKV